MCLDSYSPSFGLRSKPFALTYLRVGPEVATELKSFFAVQVPGLSWPTATGAATVPGGSRVWSAAFVRR